MRISDWSSDVCSSVLHRLLDMQSRNALRATPGSDTTSKMRDMFKSFEALARGPGGMNAVEAGGLMRTLRLYMETIPGLDQAATIDRLLTRAQRDPDVAKHLLSAPVDTQTHTRWTKHLFRLHGLAAAETGKASGEEKGGKERRG